MKIPQWLNKILFKHWHKYGHAVYVPGDEDWGRYIERHLGGATGLYGDPKDEFRVSMTKREFRVKQEIRDWAKEQKVWMKFHVDVDRGSPTFPRSPHLVLSFIFLTQEDAAQFKLTFL